MISIIICSRNPKQLEEVQKSIEGTIGVAYEIIVIDNSTGAWGICAAYNRGAWQSKYNTLCFMHEDLIFHTHDWGKVVVRTLSDPDIGLIGVIGGLYKSKMNSGWWKIPEHLKRLRVIQHFPERNLVEYQSVNPNSESISDVVNLDGLWLCTRKEVWDKYKFDEENFKEFHYYDLDLSMQIRQAYRVCVVHDILMEHKSIGNVNTSWINNSFIFNKKWKDLLPAYDISLTTKEKMSIEYESCKSFTLYLIENRYSSWYILLYLSKCFCFEFFNRDNYWLLKQWLRKNLIRVKAKDGKVGVYKS